MGVKVEIVDKDLGWSAFFKRAREMEDAKVKVGVLSDTAAGGMHEPGSDLTVAEIAVVNEFGTEDGHIPARSFVRSTFDEQREKLVELGKQLMGAVLDGKMDVKRALGLMGAKLASDVKAKIVSGVAPANAPSTIKKKGSAKTLVNTGRLLGAVTWALVTGKSEE